MSNTIIALVHLSDNALVAWFDNGESKKYTAQDLGIDSSDVFKQVAITNEGSAIAWRSDGRIDADDLIAMGTDANYVEQEKRRLLKSLSQIRREAAFSQTRLGEAAGIRQSVISRIEGCEISPQINTLLKLLAPLGKTLAIVDLKEE